MRAYVREATQLSVRIARQQERLVEVAGQHLARRERARQLDVVEVAEPLPGACKDALARQRMEGRIDVERARQRACQRDVGVDREGKSHG